MINLTLSQTSYRIKMRKKVKGGHVICASLKEILGFKSATLGENAMDQVECIYINVH